MNDENRVKSNDLTWFQSKDPGVRIMSSSFTFQFNLNISRVESHLLKKNELNPHVKGSVIK